MPVYVSDRLTATLGVVRGSPTPTRLIQWFRGSTVISGANASTYTITSDDIGQPISVRQTESNYFGSAVATSAATEDVEVFDPSILFSASEPGVWFDPTDAANLAWRRNLLLQTQEFNLVWSQPSCTITPNSIAAPDGTMTADTITHTGLYGNVSQTLSVPAGTYTLSYWVKAGTGTNPLFFGFFNGAWNEGPSVVQTATWTRHSYTFTSATTITTVMLAQERAASGFGSSYIWGAQLELGSVATTYQPITNLNAEVIAQFPNATLYQDSTGSIPVYAPEQPVGLMLDKSKGLVLGPELVVNGDFSAGTTDWLGFGAGTGWNVTDGKAVHTAGTYGTIRKDPTILPLVAGKTYLMTFSLSGTTTSSVYAYGGGILLTTAPISENREYRYIFTAIATGTMVGFEANTSFNGSIDNVSIKELPGNHATQSTAISRPLYGIVPQSGRRNLLTYSEQFEVNWAQTRLAISNSTTTDPVGGTNADLITVTEDSADARIRRTTTQAPSTSYTLSVYAKAGTANFLNLYNIATNGIGLAWFNLATGTLGTVAAGITAAITSVGGGWYRCSIAQTHASTISTNAMDIRAARTDNSTNVVAGDSILIYGAQLETGTTVTAYQKVTNDYDVTEAGVASVGYLRFDGTNDFMLTSTITPGTDKAQVFTGVRKLSDVTGMLTELSASALTNAGSFTFVTGTDNGALGPGSGYTSLGRGSAAPAAGQTAQIHVAAPDTAVLAVTHDIAGDLSTLRRNGVAGTSGTADKGTGNFLAYQMYLGRRGGTSFEFNGQLFPLIVRFGPNMSSALIRTTENWVASKTSGVTLP